MVQWFVTQLTTVAGHFFVVTLFVLGVPTGIYFFKNMTMKDYRDLTGHDKIDNFDGIDRN